MPDPGGVPAKPAPTHLSHRRGLLGIWECSLLLFPPGEQAHGSGAGGTYLNPPEPHRASHAQGTGNTNPCAGSPALLEAFTASRQPAEDS